MGRKKSFADLVRLTDKTLKKIKMTDQEVLLEQELLADIASGLDAKGLREKYSARLTARLILEALTAEESRDATSAIRDITDRSEGKAAEKKDVTHHWDNLSSEQVEAMLLTEIDDLRADKTLPENIN